MLGVTNKSSLESACVQMDRGHGVPLLILIEFGGDLRPGPPQVFTMATL